MNRLEIENWLAGLPLSNQTKNHILYTFRIVLRDAEIAGYIPFNVLEKIERFGDDAKKRDVFTLEELKSMFPDDYQKLIEIWGSLKHAVCYMILATTGIRTGEVRALYWRHNIAEGALLIEQAVKADDTICYQDRRYADRSTALQGTAFLRRLALVKGESTHRSR